LLSLINPHRKNRNLCPTWV